MKALVERSRAHLLEVEPTVQNRREGRVHVVSDRRAVRPHLVSVDEPAEHVGGPETVRQKAVRPAEKRALVPFADVLGQRHHNVGHHHRVLAHGALSLGLGPLVDPLYAPLDRGPVRLHSLHRLHHAVGGVDRERVVHPDPGRVDVVALQTGQVAAVVREHVAYRGCLVLLEMCHKSKTFQVEPDFSRLKSSMLAFLLRKRHGRGHPCTPPRPRRHGSRTARGSARMRGQAPSNSPLSRLFVTRHTSRIYSVVVAEYIRDPI